MRQLSPPTNLVLVLLMAAVVAMTPGLPWYAEPLPIDPESTAGPVETAAATMAAWFGAAGAEVTGAEAASTWRTVLLALAGAGALLACSMYVAAVRRFVRTPLKLVPMAVPAVVVLAILDAPPGLDLRWGVFAALAAGLLFANSAFHAAELRDHKPRPAPYSASPSSF